MRALILGCAGPELNRAERQFLIDTDPFGFILFQRNCESPEQIRMLTEDLRDCVGRHAPVLIDQEGGRVQRLKPPQWRAETVKRAIENAGKALPKRVKSRKDI